MRRPSDRRAPGSCDLQLGRNAGSIIEYRYIRRWTEQYLLGKGHETHRDDDTVSTSSEYYRIKILTDEGKKYVRPWDGWHSTSFRPRPVTTINEMMNYFGK